MKTKPVLLVEDNENDVFLMKRAWQRVGVANPLHVVASSQEAKDYLEGRGVFATREVFPLPCVVIMDLRLRNEESLLLLKWLRSHPELKTLVVVILSGSTYKGDVKQAYLLGVNSFLTKPNAHEELTELVRLIRDYWLKANHNPPECEVNFDCA